MNAMEMVNAENAMVAEELVKFAVHATELEKEKIVFPATEREDFLVRIAPIKNT